MKLLLIIASVLLSLMSFSGEAFAAKLEKVSSYAKDGAFYTEFSFDQNVSADVVSLDYINETVQVNLSNTTLGTTGDKSISTKVSDDKVSSVYTYKLDDGSVRSRIIYKKGIQASEFQNSTTSEVQGKKVIVKVADRAAATVAAVSDKVSDEDMAKATEWIEAADKKTADDVKIAEAKALENKKESEIPVLAAKSGEVVEKKASSTSRIILSLGLVLGLLFGFSVFLKKFLRKTPLKKNSQIKVLTQHYLGPKKSLAIIRVAGESMLIGVTDNNINLIKTLALLDEEIPQDTPRDFSKSLDQSMGLAGISGNAAAEDEAEEFSISKIKDFVSGRLKNMKEL